MSESDKFLKEAQELIFSDCKLSDTKTPSVSITLLEKTVAKLLMRINAIENKSATDKETAQNCGKKE